MMPFGLAAAPSTFQRTINSVLSPVLGQHILPYLADAVSYSRSFEEHLAHLDETLNLLSRAGSRLKLSKCQFANNQFIFLGFLVTPEGTLPDPGKVEAITKMSSLRTVRQVRYFLGTTGCFRRHIEHYAMVAMHEKFKWDQKQHSCNGFHYQNERS